MMHPLDSPSVPLPSPVHTKAFGFAPKPCRAARAYIPTQGQLPWAPQLREAPPVSSEKQNLYHKAQEMDSWLATSVSLRPGQHFIHSCIQLASLP